MTTDPLPIQPGDEIAGKYRVEKLLGTGGVGVVVAARHMVLAERVALKFLLPDAISNRTDVERFCREAQATVRLKNEHVARVTDVGTLDNGAPYMVMECLEGFDLGRCIERQGTLAVDDAVDYILQACEAVAEAHSLGIVHRDLKPSNLFLTHRPDGTPLIKVLDFGIAKATTELDDDSRSLTKTRSLLGSPVYMSPEQVRSARSVDHRTDIWSLGVCLFELLTGCLPFDGDSVTGVAAAVASDPVPSLQEYQAGIPVEIAQIVERCLTKSVDERYQSVAELADALAPFATDSGRVCIERVAGTLGVRRPRLRSAAGLETTASGNSSPELASATTLVGDLASPKRGRNRRPLAWVAAGVFLVGGVLLVLATRGALLPSGDPGAAAKEGSGESAPANPRLASESPAGAGDPVEAALVQEATVDSPQPPVQQAKLSAAGASPAVVGLRAAVREPAAPPVVAPPSPVVEPPPQRPAPAQGSTARVRSQLEPAASPSIPSRPAGPSRQPVPDVKQAPSTPSPGGGIIDGTVDTRI